MTSIIRKNGMYRQNLRKRQAPFKKEDHEAVGRGKVNPELGHFTNKVGSGSKKSGGGSSKSFEESMERLLRDIGE
ncbi:hypothetical protein D1BOALGB6SA_10301 [Olavius sp. associated proteobacterium Delta 1]|nr:hypothetical protein D1BOALGB6SA_10301 [Olavius sp. associated proteobacterium Delta 1]